jgi:hypothetical protein
VLREEGGEVVNEAHAARVTTKAARAVASPIGYTNAALSCPAQSPSISFALSASVRPPSLCRSSAAAA